MRIVAVADTHTFESDLVVPHGDVFIHAGDMCRGGTLEELEGVARWLRSLPHRTKIVVAGNHDGAFQTDHDAAVALLGPDILYLQDSGVVVDGVHFWGSPWQPAFHDWAFNLPRGAALAAKWASIPDDVDVLITHGPPAGNGDRASVAAPHAARVGCVDLARRVREVRPAAHFFGHVHRDGGLTADDGIAFINCTTWEADRPATVVDLVDGRVVPVFVPPPEWDAARGDDDDDRP
ncbi:MAG TPA: metallophosphatase domain-containing protein [Myxococcota bacterium]